MKISILCEGRLNKGIENELCDIYIKRTLSLKQSGILNLEIKNKPNKTNNTIKTLNNNRIEFLNFFIGKPEGLSEDYSEYEKISLSKMTLPHSLARVILCEQIYRCATILTNHPYHKS
jgi:23S rRNA (pseudouridine1915-N3)-methyltransferase